MIGAIIGVVRIIIGTILGFGLNEITRLFREKRTEKKQAQAVRTLLSLEIDQNLALLRDFLGKVKHVDMSKEKPVPRPLIMAQRLIELPLPCWSHKMWESQMPLLATALNEEEIRQVHLHHSKLDTITDIRTKLYEEVKPLRDGEISEWASYRLSEKVPPLWEECERIVSKLFALKNPLQPQTQNSR
ncbi:MAG: hypothetical protein ACUZ77_00670 [Candidatus Brocadiales bacterium]